MVVNTSGYEVFDYYNTLFFGAFEVIDPDRWEVTFGDVTYTNRGARIEGRGGIRNAGYLIRLSGVNKKYRVVVQSSGNAVFCKFRAVKDGVVGEVVRKVSLIDVENSIAYAEFSLSQSAAYDGLYMDLEVEAPTGTTFIGGAQLQVYAGEGNFFLKSPLDFTYPKPPRVIRHFSWRGWEDCKFTPAGVNLGSSGELYLSNNFPKNNILTPGKTYVVKLITPTKEHRAVVRWRYFFYDGGRFVLSSDGSEYNYQFNPFPNPAKYTPSTSLSVSSPTNVIVEALQLYELDSGYAPTVPLYYAQFDNLGVSLPPGWISTPAAFVRIIPGVAVELMHLPGNPYAHLIDRSRRVLFKQGKTYRFAIEAKSTEGVGKIRIAYGGENPGGSIDRHYVDVTVSEGEFKNYVVLYKHVVNEDENPFLSLFSAAGKTQIKLIRIYEHLYKELDEKVVKGSPDH